MARPRLDKFMGVDRLLISKAADEARNSVESPTTLIRRVVSRCWNCDPDYAALLLNFLPLTPDEIGVAIIVDKVSVRRVMGQSEQAVLRRVLKRLEASTIRIRGQLAGRGIPSIHEPSLSRRDGRRGRRRV